MNIKKIAAIVGGVAVVLAAGSAIFVKASDHQGNVLKALTQGKGK